MSNRQVRLPMVDDHKQHSCCGDKQDSMDNGDLKPANWLTGSTRTLYATHLRIFCPQRSGKGVVASIQTCTDNGSGGNKVESAIGS